ncbi:hypothetical protein BRC95_09855 [Halobacteriales archaeon QS_5_68_33]|nr:MAG: hypothetical protein BRC95_09855 [Halobacteriales archaeon QS_5_68_33]
MFRLLLDEMTEGRLAEYLAKMGHDVERVVDCPALGPGTDDGDIVAYAEREEQLLVTADDDFLAEHDALNRIGVLFLPDNRMSAFDTANALNEVATQVDQAAIVAHDEPYHLTGRWL